PAISRCHIVTHSLSCFSPSPQPHPSPTPRSSALRLVPSAVSTVLGVEIGAENPLPCLVAALRNKRMLLLLDNCEHVIDAAASMADRKSTRLRYSQRTR